MTLISAVVTVVNLLLSLLIGARLLLRRHDGGPELWLGIYFVLAVFVGGFLNIACYAAWADPALGLPTHLMGPVRTLASALNCVGAVALFLFGYLTFRRGVAWARALVGVCLAIMLGAYAVQALNGFTVRVVEGPAYWVEWAVRAVPLVWLTVESLRYWSLARRRVRLGLADPLVTNRFALWGLWSLTVLLMTTSEPVARILYVRMAGTTTEWIAEVAQPLVFGTVAVTSVVGSVAVTTLFLTFFPTARYRRWINARAQAGS